MGVLGRFRHHTRHRAGGRSSWERTSILADASSGGRRYLSQVPSLLPKDVLETQHLDFQFYLIRNILRGNHASPLRSEVASILDVGCDTGRWVMEMARRMLRSTGGGTRHRASAVRTGVCTQRVLCPGEPAQRAAFCRSQL